MNRCFSCTGAKRNRASKLWVVLLCLASMIGCQGFSSKSSSVQQTPVGALGANPTSLNFGTVQTGTNQVQSETVTNTGGSSVTISKVDISGTGFSLSGISTPATLTAGQSATFSVKFAPLSAGNASGSVTVTSNGSNPTLTIAVSGASSTTAGQLTASPAPFAEGTVFAGLSGTASGSLTATGSNVTITAATSSNS